jgi:hypothetical protein
VNNKSIHPYTLCGNIYSKGKRETQKVRMNITKKNCKRNHWNEQTVEYLTLLRDLGAQLVLGYGSS